MKKALIIVSIALFVFSCAFIYANTLHKTGKPAAEAIYDTTQSKHCAHKSDTAKCAHAQAKCDTTKCAHAQHKCQNHQDGNKNCCQKK